MVDRRTPGPVSVPTPGSTCSLLLDLILVQHEDPLLKPCPTLGPTLSPTPGQYGPGPTVLVQRQIQVLLLFQNTMYGDRTHCTTPSTPTTKWTWWIFGVAGGLVRGRKSRLFLKGDDLMPKPHAWLPVWYDLNSLTSQTSPALEILLSHNAPPRVWFVC